MSRKELTEELSALTSLDNPNSVSQIRAWLAEERWYRMVREALTSETAAEYFDTDRLAAMADAHYEGRANHARQIWTVYTFLTWHRVFFGA